jgi:cytochrome P450 family 109
VHPFSTDVKECPYPHYDRWRGESPVLWNKEMGAWLVLGYKEAVFVLDNHQIFSSTNSVFSPMAEDVQSFPSIINIDEPRHKKLRALAAKAFTPKSLSRDWAPRIERIVGEQLDGVTPDTFNVIGDLAYPLPVRMIAEVIGVESENFAQFKKWSDELAKGIGGVLRTPEEDIEFQKGLIGLNVYFMQQMQVRREQPADDLFTHILEAEVDGERLTPVEMVAFLVLLLVAGNETTTNLIGTAVRQLAEDPAMMKRVRADRSLVWNLMEESLRYEAPIQGFYRKARRDTELAGQQIKAGDALCVMFAAGNRDPKEFECPAEFKLDKARRDHLAFGKGVHYCLGAGLARLEADIAINAVLDRFETLTPLADYDVKWRKTPFFRGMVEYPVRYTPRDATQGLDTVRPASVQPSSLVGERSV